MLYGMGTRARLEMRVPPDLFQLSGGTTGFSKLIPRTHDDYAYNARACAELEDGLKRANDSPYALGASIWTTDIASAVRAARRFETGFVWVNTEPSACYQLPFGGKTGSGFGREHGVEALLDYTEVKSIVFGNLGEQ